MYKFSIVSPNKNLRFVTQHVLQKLLDLHKNLVQVGDVIIESAVESAAADPSASAGLLLRQGYLRGHTFRALIGPGIFYSTHAARTHASAAAGMHERTGMNGPACMHAAATATAASSSSQLQQQHACMHAGSFMPVRSCRFVHAC